MEVVIQEERTGCGIASVANVVKVSYLEAKSKANSIGIFAEDKVLFSDTGYVRKLLAEYSVNTSHDEKPFEGWEELPNLALLSIKHRVENGVPFWHWVVFCRADGKACVLDSAAYLDDNIRVDFESMSPKWYIEIEEI